MNIKTNKNGKITHLETMYGTVSFRDDCFAGPSIVIEDNGKQNVVGLNEVNQNSFYGEYKKIKVSLHYIVENNYISIGVKIKNDSSCIFNPERLFLRLGINNYMATYPEWNNILFPTLLRCEKTHFYGYFMSPNGQILCIASKDPIKSWKLDYNILNEEHNGHRIYTTELDLLSSLPQPKRHPQGFESLNPHAELSREIFLIECADLENVKPAINSVTGIEFLEADKYTLSENDKLSLNVLCNHDYKINIYDANDKKLYTTANNDIDYKFNNCGTYRVELVCEYISNIYLYKRKPWSYYLDVARKHALLKPQKATTHLEAWYGFFSAFLGAKHIPLKEYDAPLKEHFDSVLQTMYDTENATPLTDPGRINNTGVAISMLCDAYEATGDEKYIILASKLGDWIISNQHTDGSYRAYYKALNRDDKTSIGTHYTAVVYPAKSMLELSLTEKKLGKTSSLWKEKYQKHFRSAQTAIDDLSRCKDNIDTEGEITFEDGMISCAALQLGMLGTLTNDMSKKEEYTKSAEYLIEKHRCLEQMLIPDCRMRNCSLRFWEAQYDVLFGENMINSPHGWTSWKTYATYYLYILTGKKDYLKRTFDSLGASMQMIDIETNELRWAFVCDPCVKTDVWVEDKTQPHKGKKKKEIVGEQYINMISDWYTVKDDNPVGAYLTMPLITPQGSRMVDNQGGCCDNDVHEHFKCLEEIALTSSFLHIEDGEIDSYNCSFYFENETLVIKPDEKIVTKVHVNTDKTINVSVLFDNSEVKNTVCDTMWIAKEYD